MTLKQEILRYYKSAKVRFKLPVKPSQHVFGYKDTKGQYKRINDQIYTAAKLKTCILRHKAIDLYYSKSRWLSPLRARYKGGNPLTHILIDSLLAFDIDPEDTTIEGIDAAKTEAARIIDLMATFPSLKLKYAAFSGRGFQIVYEDINLNLTPDYKKRITTLERDQKAFILQYLSRSKIDEVVTANINAVVRIIGSANSRTGFICTELTRNDLNKPIKELLDYIPCVYAKDRPAIGHRMSGEISSESDQNDSEMIRHLTAPAISPTVSSEQVIAPQLNMPASFVTSQILGTKDRRVLFLTYDLPYKSAKQDILKLIGLYNLTTVYIFELRNLLYAVCLKPLQKRRISKITNYSKSIRKGEILRYGKTHMPLQIGEETLQFRETIYGNEEQVPISKGHQTLLKLMGVPIYKNSNLIGKDSIVTYRGLYYP
jgi:hypothetical protein